MNYSYASVYSHIIIVLECCETLPSFTQIRSKKDLKLHVGNLNGHSDIIPAIADRQGGSCHQEFFIMFSCSIHSAAEHKAQLEAHDCCQKFH
jgi:hypothetical protein